MVTTADTLVRDLIINRLTRDQYKAAEEAGTINPDEVYLPTGPIPFSDLTGSISDNATLQAAFDAKQDVGDYATNTALTTGLATKQDTISDLETIRAGALLGSTALQSVPSEYITETELASYDYVTNTEFSNGLSTKQNTISDLETIRSGAALGATALQSIPSEYITETELANYDYTTNTALSAETTARTTMDATLQTDINSRATSTALTEEINARTEADTTLQSNIDAKQNKLTAGDGISISSDNVISSTTIVNIDNSTITENSSGQIQASAIIDQGDNLTNYDWTGTSAEYETGRANGTIPDNWLCYITDDFVNTTDFYNKTEIDATVTTLTNAIADINTTIGNINTALAAITGES